MNHARVRGVVDICGPLCAGIVVFLAFPPFSQRWALMVGLLAQYYLTRKRPVFATGYLYGIGLLAPMLHWLWHFHPLAPFGAIVLSAVPYGLASRVSSSPLRFAAAYTAAEFFRSVGALAFPWGQLGTTLAEPLMALALPFIGVFGLSFLALFVSALLIERPVRGGVLAVAVIILSATLPRANVGTPFSVAVVQGNVAPDEDYEFKPREIMAAFADGTRGAAARGARLVCWTETVILEYLNYPCGVRDEIQTLADECGVTIVVGAPAYVGGDKRNSAFIFSPRGSHDTAFSTPKRYDKVHLVPFGEFVPGMGPDREHRILPEGVGDFTAALIPIPREGIGALVCFEGAFPELSHEMAHSGAKLLVNISNDAWANSAAEALQHAALCLPRAAENGLPMIRAGNAGPSFIADGGGRVIAAIGAYEKGIIVADVSIPERGGSTIPPDAFGWLVLLGLPFFLTSCSLLAELKD